MEDEDQKQPVVGGKAAQVKGKKRVMAKKGKKKKAGRKGLISRAEEALIKFQPQEALTILSKILAKSPQDTEVMDLVAQAHMDMGDNEKALAILKKSCTIAPNAGWSKWMYAGQLTDGKTSLNAQRKAVALMEIERKRLGDALNVTGIIEAEEIKEKARALGWELSNAYCSIFELYTTDLCDEAEAEQECEKLLRSAVSVCKANPQPYLCLTSLRLLRARRSEALQAFKQCVSLLDGMEPDSDDLPPYAFRAHVAQTAMELDLFDVAASNMEKLLLEDDRSIDMWLMSAECHLRIGDAITAASEIEKIQLMLLKDPDSEVEGCVKMLETKLASLPVPEEADGADMLDSDDDL